MSYDGHERLTVEALPAAWRRSLDGARQRANTNEDFAAIAAEEKVLRRCADQLARALLNEREEGAR